MLKNIDVFYNSSGRMSRSHLEVAGKFQYVRIITDVVCVLLGVALVLISGGAVRGIIAIAGVGTIITAFFMGPLIEFFNVHCARPILNSDK